MQFFSLSVASSLPCAATLAAMIAMTSAQPALAGQPAPHSTIEPATTKVVQASKQDQAIGIGLGTGMVVGAIVGGPIGAAVAGVLGAVVGDNSVKHGALEQADITLAAQASELATLNQALINSRQQHARLLEHQQRWYALSSAVQFATGSAELNPQYTHQLDALASVLQHEPGLTLTLTGYADARGTQDDNLALSARRAAQVHRYLLDAGVDPQQLTTQAQGEVLADAKSPTADQHFFQRKVVLELQQQPEALTAWQE